MEWGPRKAELDRLHRGARVRRVRSLVGRWMLDAMRAPRVATPAPLPAVEAGQLAVTFGGHASVLLRTSGLTIAFDPMLGRWAGGAHRAVESALTPAHLGSVELVLVSHAHRDHLHLPSLEAVPRTATVIVPSGVAATLSPLGFARVVELQPDATMDVEGVKVTATAVSHGRDPLARSIGYVVAGDGPVAFLCGDAGYSPSFAQVGARFAPDVVFLPIGGFLPWSFRERHMSPLDALFALEDLGARVMIPIHHGAFALSYERLDEPERWLRQLVEERGLGPHVRILPIGGTEVFTTPEELARQATGADAVQAAAAAPAAAAPAAPVAAAPVAAVAAAPVAAVAPAVPAALRPAAAVASAAAAAEPAGRPGTSPASRIATAPVPPWAPAPSSAAIQVPSLDEVGLVPPGPRTMPPMAAATAPAPAPAPARSAPTTQPPPSAAAPAPAPARTAPATQPPPSAAAPAPARTAPATQPPPTGRSAPATQPPPSAAAATRTAPATQPPPTGRSAPATQPPPTGRTAPATQPPPTGRTAPATQPPPAAQPDLSRTVTPVVPMSPQAFDDETVVEPSPGSKLGGNVPRLPR